MVKSPSTSLWRAGFGSGEDVCLAVLDGGSAHPLTGGTADICLFDQL
jgi:hypothetical protein